MAPLASNLEDHFHNTTERLRNIELCLTRLDEHKRHTERDMDKFWEESWPKLEKHLADTSMRLGKLEIDVAEMKALQELAHISRSHEKRLNELEMATAVTSTKIAVFSSLAAVFGGILAWVIGFFKSVH